MPLNTDRLRPSIDIDLRRALRSVVLGVLGALLFVALVLLAVAVFASAEPYLRRALSLVESSTAYRQAVRTAYSYV
ncbi:MAG: hypothetical protein SV253_03775 [Halobacteria archaeon]|nr:hypothetical protein [Halobacteria archaeon]